MPTQLIGTLFLFAVVLIVVLSLALRLIEMRNRMGTLLHRVDAKLDLLLRQANIKYDPYADVPGEVTDAIRAGKKIQAIKLYRDSTGIGIKEAKDFIEEFQRRVK